MKEQKLKQCPKNPAHIWYADIPYCPYCNITPEARAIHLQKELRNARK